MSLLIDELKREHSEIVGTLHEVRNLGVLTKEGQSKLLALREVLLEHLKNEDEHLYPVLKSKAKTNKSIKNTLNLFSADMNNVSKIVQNFFKKYSTGTVDSEYQKEFDFLVTALGERIRNEEDLLYDEFERIEQ